MGGASSEPRPEAQRETNHCQRGLGAYPLSDRQPTALLLKRAGPKPSWGRRTGCAFAVSHACTDQRTRKQAMADDHVGWGAAERAEIGNHISNRSWTYIDRSDVPANRSIVRLIWVYKRKRSGSLKARLSVQGCAQVHGVDYYQRFSATLRPTSLRTLAALAATCGLQMRRWDFVAAYLQGELQSGEVVYCHAPPGLRDPRRRWAPAHLSR
eukprot:81550-Pleurochrysis_carterae.AAC.2